MIGVTFINDMPPQGFKTQIITFLYLCVEETNIWGVEWLLEYFIGTKAFISHFLFNGALKSPTLLHLKDTFVFVVECRSQHLNLHWRFEWYQDVSCLGLCTTWLLFLYVYPETMDCIPQLNINMRVHRGPFYWSIFMLSTDLSHSY